MKFIKQLDDWGCGSACIAMVCSISYKDANLIINGKNKGTKWHEMLSTLKKLKFKFKKKRGSKGLDSCKTAIVAVSWAKGTAKWHFVVYHKGKVYDPLLNKPITMEQLMLDFPIIRSYLEIF